MAMSYEQYQNKRSWLVDTAETPADKKKLKADLAKLDAEYKAQAKAAAKPTPKATAKAKETAKPTPSASAKPTQGSVSKTVNANKFSPEMTPEDLAMKKLLEKKYGKIYG